MKVTLLNDSFPPVIDGVANVVMNYAKILQEEKLADVMVATPAYPGAEYHSYPYWVVPYQSFDTVIARCLPRCLRGRSGFIQMHRLYLLIIRSSILILPRQ